MPFRDGTPSGMAAVALSIRQPGGGREELIIFDDERYPVKSPERMQRLGEAMAEGAGRKAGVPLVLMADQRISHGTITRIVNMARAAGFHEVNIAAREPAPVFIRDDTKRP
jgi:hypothetical protein